MDYTTIAGPVTAQFIEKRSRFIGFAAPVANEAAALALLAEKRREHWDANHNVYAYILRQEGISRFSDDGEPAGTAGRPVLEVLSGSGFTDLLVVVTRYFGGVLLGTGGLVRAYAQAARLALEATVPLRQVYCAVVEVAVEYSLYDTLRHQLPRWGVSLHSESFAERVSLRLLVPQPHLQALLDGLQTLTGAGARPEITGWQHAALPPL